MCQIINTGMERSENELFPFFAIRTISDLVRIAEMGNSSIIRLMVELFSFFAIQTIYYLCNSNHLHHISFSIVSSFCIKMTR